MAYHDWNNTPRWVDEPGGFLKQADDPKEYVDVQKEYHVHSEEWLNERSV
eukprot:CAMPEP_0185777342 /NCGR_PEP_ID=MMETSP1174-20130828/89060_1 /TAXON_ID=35687 /ORGANISM="Dictyocha speculum, Strain CCMP1381" /LENGTH=49 /DNA_ID=CAMNT_0028465671 /DNA_START=1015 /DNA_END=1164 /DNA_ORIENTATION=-